MEPYIFVLAIWLERVFLQLVYGTSAGKVQSF